MAALLTEVANAPHYRNLLEIGFDQFEEVAEKLLKIFA
jgi:hypothetical protein